MEVHKEAVVIAVLNRSGKLVMESIVETKASSLLQFIHGLRGELHVTWEEGTGAAWRYDRLQPQVTPVLVCDPRRNALLKEGNKSDKIDARKLADLLRTGMLRPVYHGEHGRRTLPELARSYQTISQDRKRVMNRIKALYPRLGHRLWRDPALCCAVSRGMVTPDRAYRRAPASPAPLSTMR
jgi:Transposase